MPWESGRGGRTEGGEVSKRATTERTLQGRGRPFRQWLRDLPIWSKLGLILVVPTIATVIVGANGVMGHVETYTNADRARTLSQLSRDAGRLVHELQNERAAATLVLSASGGGVDGYVEAYRRQFPLTDEAQASYTVRRSGLVDLPPTLTALLRRIDGQLSELPALRNKVAAREGVSLTHTAFSYRVVIANLIAVRESSAQLAGETSLSDRMRAAAAVSAMKEALSQQRVIVLRALGERSLPQARVREFVEAIAAHEQALQSFLLVATPGERSFYDLKLSGDDLRLARKYQGTVESIINSGIAVDRNFRLEFTQEQWDSAQREHANLLREVEAELDNRMEATATAVRDGVVRQVLLETGLLVSMLALAVVFAWAVARSMARSLRVLRQGALSVAQYGLPQAVARLRDPALATQMSPSEVAAQIAEPLPVRSRDEFGQVTEAFNAVHMEAVRTAAEQAALRASVATMFVNLARRSQILVDRLIGHLDRLERGEEDPDRLAELFQLDHLATRMRRNDENLLVLAGADSTRVQREPAALLDVLRAAQSEVEHYTRIEFGVVDRDIEVAAHAVNDLAHLVAELLDNATTFSPPDSSVVVEARRMGDQAVLLVEDHGIGISPEQLAELNQRLATPPTVDVTVSRMMGLVVVARLAARHGVKVELRRGRERGTVAEVTLPTSVLVPRGVAARVAAGARELPQHRQVAAPRPVVGAPLALESSAFSAASHAPAPPTPRPDTGGPASRGPLPPWSDLAGVGANGAEPPTPAQASQGTEPLPQRRPGESRIVDRQLAEGQPLIPRQVTPEPNGYHSTGAMSAPPTFPVSAPPVSGPPVSAPPSSAPPYSVSAPPASAPPFPVSAPPRATTPRPHAEPADQAGSPPPTWPPVRSDAASTPTPPAVPGELAAALDITTEIPKVRGEQAPAAPPAASAPTAVPADPHAARVADETMELPIFREVESVWFRTRRPVPQTTQPSATSPEVVGSQGSEDTQAWPAPAGAEQDSGRTTGSTSMISMPTGPGGPTGEPTAATASTSHWHTAADEGWRAASAAAEIRVTETTPAGLPKRVPMAQLVPGGVDRAASSSQRRTPDAVRGLLSAYHRGVQRGRTQPKDWTTAEPDPAGPQTSQAGKEQEA